MKTLLLCALVAGVIEAECFKYEDVPNDGTPYCGTVGNNSESLWCPCPESVESKIEKLEKRVTELEQIQEATGFPKGSIILEKTTDSTLFDQIREEDTITVYTRVEEPTINPHPFGTEPDSQDKPLPDNVCPKCGKSMVKMSTGVVLTSNPPQYPWHWKCGCGHVGKGGVDRGFTQDQMFMNQWNFLNP